MKCRNDEIAFSIIYQSSNKHDWAGFQSFWNLCDTITINKKKIKKRCFQAYQKFDPERIQGFLIKHKINKDNKNSDPLCILASGQEYIYYIKKGRINDKAHTVLHKGCIVYKDFFLIL